MPHPIRFYILNLLYWLLLAVIARALFISFYWMEYPGEKGASLRDCFIYGLRLDISFASYILAFTFLIWFVFYITRSSIFFKGYRTFGFIALGIILLITLADIAIYAHWKMKINMTALQFALHPREVMASIGSDDNLPLLGFLFIVLMFVLGRLWFWVCQSVHTTIPAGWRARIIAFVIFFTLGGLSVIGMRGGFQLEPINQSAVYFSEQAIYNHTAVNASWNLLNKWVNNREGDNPYHYASAEDVKKSMREFYAAAPSTIPLVDSGIKPNIVFIILEGFTADVIGAFGGESGLTPTIDSLIKNGLVFTRFYSNGDRTYKGLPSILNGWPTQATSSVTQNPDKTGAIPSISKLLATSGYHSRFYYGGESEFANIKSYLLNTGFDKIIDIKDFPSSYRGLKWGVSDHYVFERMSKDLSTVKQPFFSCILTLSSHEPYDIPIEPLLKSKAIPDLFRNTVYYTDWSLARFIAMSKDEPWFKSTLFVLTADHGNAMPKDYKNNYDPGRFKIPLFIFGDPLRQEWKGKVLDRTGSHTDLAATVLQNLEFDTGPFRYSRNLLSRDLSGRAFYTFDNGFGLINDSAILVYDHVGGRILSREGPVTDSLLTLGKRLLQGTFDPL